MIYGMMLQTSINIIRMKGQKMDGSIQVYYGNGRGKTTAALGLGIRAAGVGKQVIMVQFLKKKHSDTLDFLKKLEPELQIFRFEKAACGYSDLSPKEKQEQMLNIKNALGYSRKVLDTGQCDLLILDEIGRGTSTFDGLSIAWAVVEHISNPKLLGAKTLFATHYHELTELEGKLDSVNNYCIAVKEKGDDIVFLRKIVKGGADRSYGIQVAKLAGLPDSVIERAKEIAEQLLANDITDTVKSISVDNGHKHKKEHLDEVDMTQISLFDTVKDDDIIDELRSIDIGNMTPLDALNKLYQLQNKVKNRW